MRQIAVRLVSRGTDGEPNPIGEFDDTGISWGGGCGQVRGDGGRQLVALLGTGHMDARFEIIIGKQGLTGCEISKVGRVLEFTYASIFLDRP